jgi:hypothetical protein
MTTGRQTAEMRRPAGAGASQVDHHPGLLIDLVSDNAANGSTADGSCGAATGKNGTADGTDTCADRRALILRRHAGTSTQAEQHCCRNCTDRESLHPFHGVASSSDEPGSDALASHAGHALHLASIAPPATTLQTAHAC